MKLSEKIKSLRKGAGLSQEEFCASPELISPESKDIIELNGIKSELTLVFD